MNRRVRHPLRVSRMVVLLSCSLGAALVLVAWGWSSPGDEAGAVVLGSGTSAPGGTTTPTNRVHSTDRAHRYANAFRISGNVEGLYPGASLPLELVIANKLSKSIVVTSISTTVTSATHSCPSTNVAVTAFAGQLDIAAHNTAKLLVDVVMAHSAPNTCQGGHFEFSYVGQGRSK